jgi:hypothetical protein
MPRLHAHARTSHPVFALQLDNSSVEVLAKRLQRGLALTRLVLSNNLARPAAQCGREQSRARAHKQIRTHTRTGTCTHADARAPAHTYAHARAQVTDEATPLLCEALQSSQLKAQPRLS